MNDLLDWLQRYYRSQCDGTWEHQSGFKIDTLDNPGWSIRFAIDETDLADVPFAPVHIERSEHDWVICRVQDGKFEGAGGPQNLTIFRAWVEAA
ncbi:MAG TPA: immunity 53 family protein [Rhizomicrobium sp.]|nr:immunity 53 family protein [Rhizomicrobium sp.]